MSTAQEIEGAISKLSATEWQELWGWMSERKPKGPAIEMPATVDWSQSAAATRKRNPARCLPAQVVLDALAAGREEAGDRR